MKKPKKISKLIIKLVVIISSLYLLLVAVAISGVFYLSYNADTYKPSIQKLVAQNSPYTLDFTSITPSISSGLSPTISFNNVVLTSPTESNAQIKFGSVLLAISYKSFFSLRPIFKEIHISDSKITLNILHDNKFLVNGFNFSNSSNSKSTFDWQYYVMLQPKIIVDQIALHFDHDSIFLPNLQISPIKMELQNNSSLSHIFDIVILDPVDKSSTTLNLSFRGDDLINYSKWEKAHLEILVHKSANKNDSYHKFIPSWLLENNFDTNSDIKGDLVNGKITKINGHLNINNIKMMIESKPIVFSSLSGNINIQRIESDYKINIDSFNLSTPQQNVFNNFTLKANYNPHLGGSLAIPQLKLSMISYLTNYLQYNLPVNLDGTLDNTVLSYESELFNWSTYHIHTEFNNISVSNQNLTLNNISGKIDGNSDAGNISLNIVNGNLIESSMFFIPYQFESLVGSINWAINNNKLQLNIPKLHISTPDFNIDTQGYYNYDFESKTSNYGYINLQATLDRIDASKVANYLPKGIPMSVHNWLTHGIIGGVVKNATLDLNGNLSDFPYSDNNGKFYITSEIESASLNYAESWPIAQNINGEFVLSNDNIYITANKGNVSNISVNAATANILKYTGDHSGIAITAHGTGDSANALNFIKTSPLVGEIGDLSKVFNLHGNANLAVKLNIPFDTPENTKVIGSVELHNNQMVFNKIKLPEIQKINGTLNFTEASVSAKAIKSSAFGGNMSTNIYTNKDKSIIINTSIKDLDIKPLTEFYDTPLSFIQGKSDYQVNLIVNSKGLDNISITSDLNGTDINMPKPLYKNKNTKAKLNVTLRNDNIIYVNYANMIKSKIILSDKNELKHVEAALQNEDFLNDSHSLIAINSVLDSLQIQEWIDFVNANQDSLAQRDKKQPASMTKDLLLLRVDSSDINYGDISLGHGQLYVILSNHGNVTFTGNTNLFRGSGTYQDNMLNLELDKYDLNNKEDAPKKPTKAINYNSIPNINLSINNFLLNNISLGALKFRLRSYDKQLQIESLSIINKSNNIEISGYSKQIDAATYDTQLALHSHSDNYGSLLNSLGIEDVLSKGGGNVDATLKSNKNIAEIVIESSQVSIKGTIKNGKLPKVATGIVGAIVGILNLSFSSIFSEGFSFDELSLDANLKNQLLNVTKFSMVGGAAEVTSYGQIDLAKDNLNLFLGITPKLGLSVAIITTAIAVAGAVTIITPVIAASIYASQEALGNPISKLLSFNYSVSGTLEKPKLTYLKISKQLTNNLSNTILLNNKNNIESK